MTEIIIRDNFLPQDTYDMLYRKYSETAVSDQVQREIFKYDPTPQIASFLHQFNRYRKYEQLGKFIHTAATPPRFHHAKHCEAEFKIMSAIVYIAPEHSNGTVFYLDETFEIEWKPNRLMIFCGETDVTWHDYRSTKDMRFTYNYFLVDPTKVENETYRNSILRM